MSYAKLLSTGVVCPKPLLHEAVRMCSHLNNLEDGHSADSARDNPETAAPSSREKYILKVGCTGHKQRRAKPISLLGQAELHHTSALCRV